MGFVHWMFEHPGWVIGGSLGVFVTAVLVLALTEEGK